MVFLKLLISFLFVLLLTLDLSAATESLEDLLEIPADYRDEIEEMLEKSKEFTEDQLEVIQDCLDESSAKEIANCFSKGGIDEAGKILSMIKDELFDVERRICGESSIFEKDRCEKFQESMKKFKGQADKLWSAWSSTMDRGRRYVEERNRLFTLKRKICQKINEDGCWKWLNERMDIKCNPKKIGYDAQKLEACQLEVANDVWDRLDR